MTRVMAVTRWATNVFNTEVLFRSQARAIVESDHAYTSEIDIVRVVEMLISNWERNLAATNSSQGIVSAFDFVTRTFAATNDFVIEES